MAFRNRAYVDARHSTINQAGRDQTTVHNHFVVNNNIYIFPQSSRQRPHYVSSNHPSLTSIGSPGTSPKRRLITYSPSDVVSIIDTAVSFIDQIADILLMENTQLSSTGHRDLALELESLQKTLTTSRLVIHKYDDQPLGQSLSNAIAPEVVQCLLALGELVESVDRVWPDFSITSIGGLCRHLWWTTLVRNELCLLRKKLSYSRQSLQGLLMALQSYVLFFMFHASIH